MTPEPNPQPLQRIGPRDPDPHAKTAAKLVREGASIGAAAMTLHVSRETIKYWLRLVRAWNRAVEAREAEDCSISRYHNCPDDSACVGLAARDGWAGLDCSACPVRAAGLQRDRKARLDEIATRRLGAWIETAPATTLFTVEETRRMKGPADAGRVAMRRINDVCWQERMARERKQAGG